ncbi:hypothetical protein ABW42_05410 [Stenotrophomonas maltophilia]|nr:hypothetical protein ABW42_05410 [Stenotrophomonas maltophilia]
MALLFFPRGKKSNQKKRAAVCAPVPCAPRPAGERRGTRCAQTPAPLRPRRSCGARLASRRTRQPRRDPCHAWMPSAWINQERSPSRCRNACDCPQKKTPGHQYRHAHRTCPSPLPSGRSRRMRLSVHLHVSR